MRLFFFTFMIMDLLFICLPCSSARAATYVITQVVECSMGQAGKAILKEAYARIGEDVRFVILPGERALQLTNNGQMDGEMFRVDNLQKKFSNLVKVPTSYITSENVAFTKSLDIPVTGYKDLKPYKIGFRMGLKIAEFETNGFPHVRQTPNSESAFLMLDAERINVVIEGRLRGWSIVKNWA